MPLVALKDGKRFDITQEQEPRALRGANGFVCPMPDCNGEMFVKAGNFIAAHFAHKVACSSSIQYHPESPEHNQAKAAIAAWLRREYPDALVSLEWPCKEIGRRADILVKFNPDGVWQAHEIQLSGITTEELEQRTGDYERLGIEVIWYLGQAANTSRNLDWCISRLGGVFPLEFVREYSPRISLPVS